MSTYILTLDIGTDGFFWPNYYISVLQLPLADATSSLLLNIVLSLHDENEGPIHGSTPYLSKVVTEEARSSNETGRLNFHGRR